MTRDNFDWEKFAFGEVDIDNAFDERILYREMRRNKIAQKANISKRYRIYIKRDPHIHHDHYITIFNRYFGIEDHLIEDTMVKFLNDGGILSHPLSSSVADLLLAEVTSYLSNNGFEKETASKEVSENAIKKPRNNLT